MQQMQRQMLAEMLGGMKRLCVSVWADTLPCLCRFIRNQLVVEITSSARLAHLFGWALKKHTILAFMLYTAGESSLHNPGKSHREMVPQLFTKVNFLPFQAQHPLWLLARGSPHNCPMLSLLKRATMASRQKEASVGHSSMR